MTSPTSSRRCGSGSTRRAPYLRIDETRARFAELEAEVQRPDLWDDQDRARQVNAALRPCPRRPRRVRRAGAGGRGRRGARTSWRARRATRARSPRSTRPRRRSTPSSTQLELRSLFTGEHDEADAICSINAKDGGVDAKDWGEMLMRMYLRWCERKGYKTEIVDGYEPAEEAGITGGLRSPSRAPTPTAICAPRSACIAWCASAPSTGNARRRTSSPRSRSTRTWKTKIDIVVEDKDIEITTMRAGRARAGRT